MATKVRAIPENESQVTPYLRVSNAAEMIGFYKKVFGATETFRLEMPDGRMAWYRYDIRTRRCVSGANCALAPAPQVRVGADSRVVLEFR